MFSFVSWNIQYGKGVDGIIDLHRIADVIHKDGLPDVLCLQEVSRNDPEIDNGRDQVNELKHSGILIDIFQFYGRKSLINYIRDRKKLKNIIKNKKIDLIHAHYGQCGYISKFKGIPLITTFHGSDTTGLIIKNGKY